MTMSGEPVTTLRPALAAAFLCMAARCRNATASGNPIMRPIMRNTLAVIAGFLVGSMVNMAIISIGPMVIPLPEGVDLSETDKFAENLRLLEPANFIAPWLAHAAGTLVGAYLAAQMAASHKMKLALGIGVLFLVGGVAMVSMFGGPVWFIVVDLVGAYLPMGYLGGRLGGAAGRKTREVDST